MSSRNRHTASFQLSHFLNSKESLNQTWLTGSLVSILRYIFDVMEMNYTHTGLCICDKSIKKIAIYSRTSRATVTRGLRLFVKYKILSIEQKKMRSPTHYGIGEFISSRFTMGLELSTGSETRLTTSLVLGSPRAYISQNKAHGEPLVRNIKKNSKKERARKPRARRPLAFEPDERNVILCQDLGLNLEEQLGSFNQKYEGTKTQDAFCRWLKAGKEFSTRRKIPMRQDKEIRSSVPEWGPNHPSYQSVNREPKKEEVTPAPVVEYESFRAARERYLKEHGRLPDGYARDNGRGSDSD